MKKESTKKIIVILGIIIVALVIFKAGMYVGYRKAGFSRTFGDSMLRDDIPGGHGVSGKIIKIATTSLVVEGSDNIEKVITFTPDTLIRKLRDAASSTVLQVDDPIIVIGSPGPNGEIAAKLIRILPQLQK